MLLERLPQRFTLTTATADQPGNLIAFPYDWRLSNQLNAQRLADAAVPHLERWRRHTHNQDAKLILICHLYQKLLHLQIRVCLSLYG